MAMALLKIPPHGKRMDIFIWVFCHALKTQYVLTHWLRGERNIKYQEYEATNQADTETIGQSCPNKSWLGTAECRVWQGERERDMVTNDSWDLGPQYLSHLCLIDGPSHLMKHLSPGPREWGARQRPCPPGSPVMTHDIWQSPAESLALCPLSSPARQLLKTSVSPVSAICWLWQAALLWVDGPGRTSCKLCQVPAPPLYQQSVTRQPAVV